MDDRELAERARSIYDARIRDAVEPGQTGKIVAIDVDTGDYFIGESVREACEEGRRKHPGKIFFSLRIGSRTTYHIGAPSRWDR